MNDAIATQLDYIYFFYGLAFILLAVMCSSLRRSGETLPWVWLSYFGFMRGVSAWLGLLIYSLGGSPWLSALRLAATVLSFLMLLEFARASTVALLKRAPGRWIVVPFLLIASLGALGGVAGIEFSLRYTLGLLAGLWAAATLFFAARRLQGLTRARLLQVAGIFTIYAVLVGVVTEPTCLPSPVVDSDDFARALHVPVELLRGILAVFAAFAIWRYYQAVSSAKPEFAVSARLRVWAAVVLGVVLVAGLFVTNQIGMQAEAISRKNLLSRTVSAATAIDPVTAARLSGSLDDLGTQPYLELSRDLQLIRAANPDVRFAYLMRLKGGRIAFLADSETRDSPDWSPPGQIYTQATAGLERMFITCEPLVEGPVRDRWGQWVSGLAPVLDHRNGRAVAVLGMDVDAKAWLHTTGLYRLVCIVFIALISLIVLTFYSIMWSREELGAQVVDSERRYRSLVDGSPNWISLVDDRGDVLMVNQAGLAALGLDQQSVVGARFADLWPELERERIERAVQESLDNGRSSVEAVCVSADGVETLWHTAINRISGSPLDTRRLTVVATDITARARVLQSLSKRLAYENMIAEISCCAIAIDDTGRFLAECLRLMGQTLDVSRALVIQYQPANDTIESAQEWCAPGARPAKSCLSGLSAERIPWLSMMMKGGRLVKFSDTALVPGEHEREALKLMGVKSLLTLPLTVGKDYYGFIDFHECRCHREWPDEDVDMIRAAVQIMIGAMERSSAIEALRRSEKQYRDLFMSANDVIVMADADGTVLEINPRGEELTGYTRDELIGANLLEKLILPDYHDRFRSVAADLMAGKSSVFTVQWRAKDGSALHFEVSSSPRFGEDGTFISTRSILRDVTERKRVEEELRMTQFAIDRASDAVFWVDRDARVIYVNDMACNSLGYSREELLKMTIYDFDVKLKPHLWADHWARKAREPFVTFESVHRSRDGRYFPVEITSSYIEFRGRQCTCAFARDITERKRADRELRDSEERFRMLVEHAADAVFLHDAEGRIIDVNERACESLGYTRDELLTMSVSEIECGEQADSLVDLWSAIEGNGAATLVGEHRRRDGTRIPVELRLALFESEGRKLFVAHARDITERLAAEASIRTQTLAINAASDQVVITDAEGRIEFVNPAFERETGYTASEVQGRTSRILRSGKHDRAFYANLWRTIRGGQTWHGEITNRRADGSLYTDDVTITPVTNGSGKIEHFMAIKRNVTEKKIYQQRLDHLAHHDALTGLPNRLLFGDRLSQKLSDARRLDRQLAVMFLDLDRFKVINDSLGHRIGDLLLKSVADRLKSALREVDTIARMGGDEFTIILSDVQSREDAAVVARKVLDSLAAPVMVEGRELFANASIGISVFPGDGADVEALVRNADTAMYRAKEQGRNTFQFYTDALNAAAVEQMTLENALRHAVEREEFVVYYQPRVDLRTGMTLGAEALVRWKHPQLGMVMPGDFIPLAEEIGVIGQIGEFVLRSACEQGRAWQEAGVPPVDIAVNVSARQFRQSSIVGIVEDMLAETGLEPRLLHLEITESTLMHSPERAASTLRKLKAMGVRVSIDDFGTGYSSLSYLKRLPIDAVKIDRSFVKDIDSNPDDAAIAAAVVSMAHSLKLRVIAEGVETIEQLEFLRSLDCDEMQGYFVSPPVSAEEFTRSFVGERGSRAA